MSELMTVSDVAKVIKKSTAMVSFLERTGQLKAERTGSGVRIFRKSDVEKFVIERRAKAQEATAP